MPPKDDTVAIARLETQMLRAQEDIAQLENEMKTLTKSIWMAMGVVGFCSAVIAPILIGVTVWFITTHNPLTRTALREILPLAPIVDTDNRT